MKEFAQRLRMIQFQRNLSQAQLAKELDIAPNTLSAYINDRNNPQIHDVARFAKKLGVSIGWLCGEGGAEKDLSYKAVIPLLTELVRCGAFSVSVEDLYYEGIEQHMLTDAQRRQMEYINREHREP